MSYGTGKLDNEYARELRAIDASKTVWMALAFSFAVRCGTEPGDVAAVILEEWHTLHVQGIVPQRPRAKR